MNRSRLCKKVFKILQNPKDVDFKTLENVLIEFGYDGNPPRGGGSHFTFRKKGNFPITVPKKHPMKEIYVKNVIKNLNLEQWHEEEC